MLELLSCEFLTNLKSRMPLLEVKSDSVRPFWFATVLANILKNINWEKNPRCFTLYEKPFLGTKSKSLNNFSVLWEGRRQKNITIQYTHYLKDCRTRDKLVYRPSRELVGRLKHFLWKQIHTFRPQNDPNLHFFKKIFSKRFHNRAYWVDMTCVYFAEANNQQMTNNILNSRC